ncbi:MAG TPA: hypothetical protein VFS56_06070, partial [Gemmatimonadaceae bacterium]|nr:hypothetical protein [Gemmatimonadaceae bacterium]
MRRSGLLLLGVVGCGPFVRVDRQSGTDRRITVEDVRSRMYLVAHDSMQGREAGEIGNVKMTNYIAAELARIGLEPGGDNGTYFQTVPMVRRRADSTSSLRVGNEDLAVFTDFAPLRPTSSLRSGTRLSAAQASTVYGGRAGDTTISLSPDQVTGKIVVLDAPLGSDGKPTAVYATPTGLSLSRFPTAAAVAVAGLDFVSAATKASLRGRGNGLSVRTENPPLTLLISRDAAVKLMGAPLESLRPGAEGRTASARIGFLDQPVTAPARNV